MKRNVLTMVGLLSAFVMAGGTAFAAVPNSDQLAAKQVNSRSQMVWVVLDVTTQDNYTITNHEYNSANQLVTTEKITAPAGSLVEFKQEPLAAAEAQHLDYVIPSQSIPLDQQLSKLHEELYQKLNPTVIQPNDYVGCGGSTTSTGQFTADGATIDYNIYWNKQNPNCDINVTEYKVWQSSGYNSATLDQVAWDGHDDNYGGKKIPSGYSSAIDAHPSQWYGSPGYAFRVLAWGVNGTSYEGYDTLN